MPSDFHLPKPPAKYQRIGCILPRGAPGTFDAHVTGDPCVVWDESAMAYCMFYFAQGGDDQKPGCCNAQALMRIQGDQLQLEKLGPIVYRNQDQLLGSAHKPWIVMNPYKPAEPARPDGRIWLLTASHKGPHKVVQVAKADDLAGPWDVQREPLVDVGPADAFDGYHADSPTGWYFPDRQEVLIFYKGYPQVPQRDQPASLWGSSLAVARMKPTDTVAHKLGKMIAPVQRHGHWASGWVGPMQLFPSAGSGWWGMFNASPTSPAPVEESPWMREPAPSQAGWAFTPEASPIKGWQVQDQPILRVDRLTEAEAADREGVNFWRHHLAVLRDGRMLLLYNSGPYGHERMFGRWAERPT